MGSFILKDAEVLIGEGSTEVDLSDHVQQVQFNYMADLKEEQAMGDLTKIRLAGLLDWNIVVTFKQDFAAGEVDATLFPLVGAAAFRVAIKPVASDSTGATNPRFEGNAVIESYPPLGGNHGDLATAQVTFQSAGTLSRSTSDV
jgi:hypothetical protein